MFPENKLKKWYCKLPANIKLVFFSTIIIGIICHAFVMTNKWLNLDDIVQLVDNMERTSSGRWFLMFPSAISSEFSIPWLNAFLTIVYSAIMGTFVISMFNIKSKIYTILIGGILVTFPTLASLMPFMNTQDSYQFGAMLAGIAAYLLVKKEYGFIYSTILLTLSLAIYQTYLGYAAGLILIYILIKLFDKNNDIRDLLILFIKMVISFISALLLYLFVSRVIFGHLLVDYKGLSNMGSLPIAKLPEIVFSTYKAMFDFFTGKEFNYHFSFMPILFIISFVLIIYLLFYIIMKSKIKGQRLYFILFILAILPPAINVIYIMSWEAGVMLRMAYAYTVCFIFPMILIEYISKTFVNENLIYEKNGFDNENLVYEKNTFDDENLVYEEDTFDDENLICEEDTFDDEIVLGKKSYEIKKRHFRNPKLLSFSAWFLTIVLALSLYNNIYVSNKVYFKVWITNKTSDTYANRIAMRIEAFKGYKESTPIVFIGNPDSRTDFTKQIDPRDVEPFIIANHLTRLYSFKYYPKRFLGLPNNIDDIDIDEGLPKELEPYIEKINKMPLYPDENSMTMINGKLYIKFKELK